MKINKLFWIGMATLMAACSDQSDELPGAEGFENRLEVQINGDIEQQYLARVNDNGFCTGDQVGVFGVNYTNDNTVAGTLQDEGNQVDNACYTYDEETLSWTSQTPAYYKDVNTNIDLYAYYPWVSTVNSTSAYAFEVEKDQNNADGYAMSDFLWAKAEAVVPSENKVRLPFTHRMSCANVILVEGENFAEGEFEKIAKSAMVLNTTRTATVDLTTGVVTATGEATSEGTLMMNASDGFRAIVVPQTVKAATALFAITIDGVTYHYKHSTAFTFEVAKQSKFTLTVNKKAMEGTYELKLTDCEIVDWIADIETHGGEARQYYVVNQEEPGTLGALIKAAGKNPDKIKNLKIVGNVDARDFYFMRDSMEILQAINMKESVIKEYVEYIGYDKIHGANEIPDMAFSQKSSLVYYVFPEKVTGIGEQSFRSTMLTGALIIPNDVTEIEEYTFHGTNISSISFPKGLTKIDDQAFKNCTSITELTLPDELVELGQFAFSGCNNVTGILNIPSNVKSIGKACFQDLQSIIGLSLSEGLETIGVQAFQYCENITGMLILPNSLKSIGSQAFHGCPFQGELVIPNEIKQIESSTFFECQFSNVVFPEGLLRIDDAAFYRCNRLSEIIEFPISLTTIGSNAFLSCSSLPGVRFSSGLGVIGVEAFRGCTYLTSIICEATNPPTVGNNAFYGVAKDNFTLEVPEASVVKYQTASGWSDFKRIAAHHDFSISRSKMRTLNAAHSNIYTLRAPSGYTWSIDKKPDWVTVTPESGTGKTDVTVTINELAKGAGNRQDTIVFLLDEKDYLSRMLVEQYDYEYGDGDVITNQTATKGSGVNLVFMGDCFDAYDISTGSYLTGINEAIEHFFAIEPYNSYKDYFNVYTVIGMSPDSGMGTVNTVKDAKFGSQYSLDGITPDTEVTYEYACKAPTVTTDNINQTLVVMVENTQDYGGICYMWNDGSAIAICPMSADAYPYDFRGIVQHEAGGHGFGKLGDEYIYTPGFIQSCSCPEKHVPEFNAAKANGWYDNMSLSGDMDEVPWSHLIYHPKYSNIVDMYEGGYFHTRGVYRSEATSCMNNNIPYFSAISRQSIVERIMEYAGETFSLDDFYANDVLDASLASRSLQAPWTISTAGASKQHAPKLMGDKPKLNK